MLKLAEYSLFFRIQLEVTETLHWFSQPLKAWCVCSGRVEFGVEYVSFAQSCSVSSKAAPNRPSIRHCPIWEGSCGKPVSSTVRAWNRSSCHCNFNPWCDCCSLHEAVVVDECLCSSQDENCLRMYLKFSPPINSIMGNSPNTISYDLTCCVPQKPGTSRKQVKRVWRMQRSVHTLDSWLLLLL